MGFRDRSKRNWLTKMMMSSQLEYGYTSVLGLGGYVQHGLLRVQSTFRFGKAAPTARSFVLTKEDVARERGETMDLSILERSLGVPVLSVNGQTGEGSDELGRRVAAGITEPLSLGWSPEALAQEATDKSGDSPAATRTERLDSVLLHPLWGLPIFAALLLGIFELLFVAADPLVGLIEAGQSALSDWAVQLVAAGALQSLLVDGIIAGVGAILVFVPQILILVFFISLMEGTGYMARVAFLLDRPLSKVGLSGRSFVPMFTSFACAVPGILATRMIDDERSRIATIVTAPLMSCSARLPVCRSSWAASAS